MKFRQILDTNLEFKRTSGPYFSAEYDGHEIGVMAGDFPPDDLYYIYFNRKQIHEGSELPPGWRISEG